MAADDETEGTAAPLGAVVSRVSAILRDATQYAPSAEPLIAALQAGTDLAEPGSRLLISNTVSEYVASFVAAAPDGGDHSEPREVWRTLVLGLCIREGIRDPELRRSMADSELAPGDLESAVLDLGAGVWTSVSSEESGLEGIVRRLAQQTTPGPSTASTPDLPSEELDWIARLWSWLRRIRQALRDSGRAALEGTDAGEETAPSTAGSASSAEPVATQIDRALVSLEQALLEKTILPALRVTVTKALGELRGTVLPHREALGLGQLADLRSLVQTESRHRLVGMATTLTTGCIGVGGPRGAGKSTLLQALTEGVIPEGDSPFAYRVLVSAPTRYDAREFLLYLCRRTSEVYLQGRFGIEPDALVADQEGQRSPRRSPTLAVLMVSVSASLLVLAAWLSTYTVFGWLVGAGAALLASGCLLALFSRSPLSVGRFRFAIRVAAASTGLGGLACLTLAVFDVSVPPAIFLAVVAVIAAVNVYPVADAVYRPHVSSVSHTGMARLEVGSSVSYVRNEDLPAAERAIALWRSTRYQLSYSKSTNASVSLNVKPVTIGGGMTRGVSQQPLAQSLPEVVDGFITWMTDVCRYELLEDGSRRNNSTLIAIDELDKMGSIDDTERFLNDIKGVFGIANCVFALSVSADALASFQRRGLPARDVVDSSVDDVVRVEPLDFAASAELLSQRVPRVPMPFWGLCFALSGGLARDLIRTARSLFALDHRARRDAEFRDLTGLPADGVSLAGASRWLVAADVVERSRGTVAELNTFVDDKTSTPASAAGVWGLQLATLTDPSELETIATRLPWALDADVPVLVREPVARLCTLVYLDSTILEVFGDRGYQQFELANDPEALRSFDRLAKARRLLAVSPVAAWREVDSYREAWQLRRWSCPILDGVSSEESMRAPVTKTGGATPR